MPGTAKPRTNKREDRFEARVSRDIKKLCQKAAALHGRTLTDLVVQNAVEAANRTIRDHEMMKLTQRDRIAFVETLLNAPAPGTRLKQAAKRHSQLLMG